MSLNIVFAGTPSFTLPCLNALAASKHQILALYTQPDRPAGRGRKLQASPVKIWGLEHGYSIYQPLNFKDEATITTLIALKPDVIIVIAYGIILPQNVLNIPRLGCINVHASLLPRLRGAAPIQYAILNGENETGISLMQMDAGMDTGPILATATCQITPTDTSLSLHDKLATLAVTPLLNLLNSLDANAKIVKIKQDETQASYAPKIHKTAAHINWQQPAIKIAQLIRAFNPWPVAYTNANDIILRIYQANVSTQTSTQLPGTIIQLDNTGLWVTTGQGILCIQRIQCPGSNILSIQDWLNSKRTQLYVGLILT